MSKKRNYRRFLIVLLVADIFAAGVLGFRHLQNSIPNTVYIHAGQEEELSRALDSPLLTYPDTIDVSDRGSYRISCSLLGILPIKEVQVQTMEEKSVAVCGVPVGLYMETEGVLVVDTGEILQKDGISCRPAANIAKAGDYILEVNGTPISGKKELIQQIHDSKGEAMELLVNRGGEKIPLSLTPVLAEDDSYKLGIWVRDNTQGIGTMTYVDTEGKFGALGHGISDTDTGELLDIEDGELYQAQIMSIVKGVKGTPGELSGYIEYQKDRKIGTIEKNTEIGIFGRVEQPEKLCLKETEIGYKQEVQEGRAELLTCVEGEVKSYEIQITDIYRERADTNKAFALRVTDPELLAATGGIVQGMSGSPILQNGKLVGAVTHVFVQDSTKGYGIFIENMLW